MSFSVVNSYVGLYTLAAVSAILKTKSQHRMSYHLIITFIIVRCCELTEHQINLPDTQALMS